MKPVLKRVLMPLANGSEEIEAMSIFGILAWVKADITVAKVPESHDDHGLGVNMSRGMGMTCSTLIGEVSEDDFDLIVLPGGTKGAQTFGANKTLVKML